MTLAPRRLALVAVVVFTAACCPTLAQDRRPTPPGLSPTEWMKQKLEMSQAILDGLTKGDFDKIETNAQKMNVINYLEKMVTADQPHYKEYTRQLTAFETANRELLRQASKKNVEGATLAYVQLTVSCVNCHKVVRDAKK
jgi:hypothetical protein